MRVVIQRTAHASVVIDGREKSAIGPGMLILVGIEEADGQEDIDWLCRKIINLRIFDDEQGVMNRSILESGGDILVVSQFTLHASTKKGNRPSYIRAARPEHEKQRVMTLEEAQKQVDDWIRTYGVRYFSELTNLAVLTEEVGELARVVARRYGDQSFKPGEKDNLSEELADVLWVLICLANQTGTDLTEAFARTLEKKTNRDRTRHLNNPKLREQDGKE